MSGVDRVLALVSGHPAVDAVELVGSRARGNASPISDWDFRIESADIARVMRDLPALTAPLQPLAAFWDPLSERAVFMLILQDGVKVDLFPGDETRAIEPPWDPQTDAPAAIDAHFWDWILWLGGKVLGGHDTLVENELVKLHEHLLGPLGSPAPAANVDEAVAQYLRLRDADVDRALEDAVLPRLEEHGLSRRRRPRPGSDRAR